MSKALSVTAAASGRQQIFDFLYKWGMLLTVVALVAVFGLASDSFLDPNNIINILRSIAIVTVIAIGVSISLTIGGFDLSVGSTASLANALVISLFVWHGLGTTEAILITLALCTLVGLFNAFLIVVLRIPDMLATLASLFVIQGVAMTYSYGGSITENMVLPSGEMAEGTIPAAFGALGQVPTIVIIMLVVTLIVTGRSARSDRVVNVCSWGEYIDESLITQFEEETGIRVNYQTAESNEALYSLIKMGGADFDVIVPSDYMIARLIDEDMLAELDYSHIPNFDLIADTYKNLSYDPENKYTVPYTWGTLGIIYNTTMVSQPITSWSAMFDPQYAGQVLMINNSWRRPCCIWDTASIPPTRASWRRPLPC